MSFISATNTMTVVSSSGIDVEAIVVSNSPKKIRVNMQGVAMDFMNDNKGNWTAKLSGLSFSLVAQ